MRWMQESKIFYYPYQLQIFLFKFWNQFWSHLLHWFYAYKRVLC